MLDFRSRRMGDTIGMRCISGKGCTSWETAEDGWEEGCNGIEV